MGRGWIVRLSHVEVNHRGGPRRRLPVRFGAETAFCGNTHLVEAPGGEGQETGRGVLTKRMFCYRSFVSKGGRTWGDSSERSRTSTKTRLHITIKLQTGQFLLWDTVGVCNCSCSFCAPRSAFALRWKKKTPAWHLTDNIHSPRANLQAGQLEPLRGFWSTSEACGGAPLWRGVSLPRLNWVNTSELMPDLKTHVVDLHFKQSCYYVLCDRTITQQNRTDRNSWNPVTRL